MTRTSVLSLVLGASIVVAGSSAPLAQTRTSDQKGDLEAAKTLYASASYEEALAKLPPDDDSDIEHVEPIRALCLLALGRTNDAQSVLERLVARRPLLKLSETDVSPRLIQLFSDVRRKVLPQAARVVYERAKSSYDATQFASASSEFKFLLTLLNDPGMADSAGDFKDLKTLADGFLRLSEAEVAAAAKAASPPPPATPASGSGAGTGTAATPTTAITPGATPQTSTPAGPVIYSATDTDVKPPVEVQRQMPVWSPPNPTARLSIYRGLLEVVIDEKGMVEMAVMRKAATEFYDKTLLDATKQWRFRPARRGNEPVKYRAFYEILLRPPR